METDSIHHFMSRILRTEVQVHWHCLRVLKRKEEWFIYLFIYLQLYSIRLRYFGTSGRVFFCLENDEHCPALQKYPENLQTLGFDQCRVFVQLLSDQSNAATRFDNCDRSKRFAFGFKFVPRTSERDPDF